MGLSLLCGKTDSVDSSLSHRGGKSALHFLYDVELARDNTPTWDRVAERYPELQPAVLLDGKPDNADERALEQALLGLRWH
jgi:hypothetical protein